MKKIIFLSIAAASMIGSCSKEELPEKKYSNFIYFKLVTNSDSLVEYGYTEYGIAQGPTVYTETKGDSTIATIYHNPSQREDWYSRSLEIAKKGSSVLGDYGFLVPGDIGSNLMSASSSGTIFYFLSEGAVFSLDKIGTDSRYGKYVEGRFRCKVLKNFDPSKEIPAWGNFRVMYK